MLHLNCFNIVILIGTVHDISAKVGHLFNCGEVITNAVIFRGSLIINSDQVCCKAPPELYSFCRYLFVLFDRRKKTNLVMQRWRQSKWFRHPCFDESCTLGIKLPLISTVNIFHFVRALSLIYLVK